MKKLISGFFVALLTFALGIFIYRVSSPKVSLETISKYTAFYDGMNVTVETYAQLKSYDDKSWYIGEPSEKMEIWTNLDISNVHINLETLHTQLKEDLNEQSYKRVRVLVKGKVIDSCNHLSDNGTITFGCCFGKSIKIVAQEVKQLAPVEVYTRPE